MKTELKFVGKKLGSRYNGFDEGKAITIKMNETIAVSEATAVRLLKDFPTDFIQVLPISTDTIDIRKEGTAVESKSRWNDSSEPTIRSKRKKK